MSTRILVVDDEPQIQRFLRPALTAVGFEVESAETVAQATRLTAIRAPDLLVLDLGLPDGDGKKVIETVRAFSAVPIIVLSARDQDAEKIAALDLGADDYVEKPFSIGELLARIRVALRHSVPTRPDLAEQRFGEILLDLVHRQVFVADRPIHLTPKEFELFTLLAKHAGRVVTHQQALTQVWGIGHKDDTQYLRVIVGQLRAKLETDAKMPRHIITEAGIGYRLIEGYP
jgi:two-component system KDP operon response regulator KdpE